MGAEGSIVIYDGEKILELFKILFNGNTATFEDFKDLGCYNIYEHKLFGKLVFTVYYGENNEYTTFESDYTTLCDDEIEIIKQSSFEKLKQRVSNYTKKDDLDEFSISYDDYFEDAMLDIWEVWT